MISSQVVMHACHVHITVLMSIVAAYSKSDIFLHRVCHYVMGVTDCTLCGVWIKSFNLFTAWEDAMRFMLVYLEFTWMPLRHWTGISVIYVWSLWISLPTLRSLVTYSTVFTDIQLASRFKDFFWMASEVSMWKLEHFVRVCFVKTLFEFKGLNKVHPFSPGF